MNHDPNPPLKDDDELENWADKTVQLNEDLVTLKKAAAATHSVMLAMWVGSPEQHKAVYDLFTNIMLDFAGEMPGMTLSSRLLEDNEDNEESPVDEYEGRPVDKIRQILYTETELSEEDVERVIRQIVYYKPPRNDK